MSICVPDLFSRKCSILGIYFFLNEFLASSVISSEALGLEASVKFWEIS
jgi:hypothetical protein